MKRMLALLLVLVLATMAGTPAIFAEAEESKHFRVLTIANSFSDDMMKYVWQIATDLGYDDVSWGSLYIGNCSISMHLQNARSDAPAYEYRTCNDGNVYNTLNVRMSEAISSQDWDYVVLQHDSGSTGLVNSYADLNQLVQTVHEMLPEVPLVWHMTWAFQSDTGVNHPQFPVYGNDQMKMYNAILSATKQAVVPNPLISTIILNGIAIQNARATSLGDTLTRDGYHLSAPLGRYIAGLTLVHTLTGLPLDDLTYAPFGVKEEQKKIAIEAAQSAVARLGEFDIAAVIDEEIQALPAPANVTLSNRAQIETLRKKIEQLDEEKKQKITAIATLEAAEAKIIELLRIPVQEVENQINALPDPVSLSDRSAVKAARTAYNTLDNDQQKMIDEAALTKLETTEQKIDELYRAPVYDVTHQINALPDPVSLQDTSAVESARAAYEDLDNAQQRMMDKTAMDKLEAAEREIVELIRAEVQSVVSLINALPNPVTARDKGAVETAKAAYDALNEEQKALMDSIARQKLEAALEKIVVSYGDINSDSSIDATDALMALQYSVKLITLDNTQFAAADVNTNGEVDAADALIILQCSVQLIDPTALPIH